MAQARALPMLNTGHVMLNFMFSLRNWRRDYVERKTTLWALPIVIAQAYPQLQVIRLIYINWKNPEEMKRSYKIWERDVGLIEPFVESAVEVCNFIVQLANTLYVNCACTCMWN